MPHSYLNGRPWTAWSREERLFCAVLYEHARRRADEFAAWLIENAGLPISPVGAWDLSFEVCFYRDYLWQKNGPTAAERGLPRKRTFDLCLFGETSVIIIEAKVCEGFDSGQLSEFKKDAERIHEIDGLQHLGIYVVALASSQYLAHARSETIAAFQGAISWGNLAERFPEPLFKQAEEMYNCRRGQFVEGGSA